MEQKVENGRLAMEGEPEEERASTEAADETSSLAQTGLDPRLTAQIEQEVARRFQSAKDKRWAALEKRYGDLHELTAQAVERPNQVNAGEGDFHAHLVGRASQLLTRTGLENDPEAVTLLREVETGEGMREYLNMLEELTEIALRRAGKVKSSAATAAQPGGGNAPAVDLRQAYEQQRKSIRPGDVNALMALKRAFREKGLEIY